MGTTTLGGSRILVVENEPLIAMELAQAIEEAGGIVAASARSRHEAVNLAQHAGLHAALLDVHLPDGTAFEVASRLAARGIPFLFCTADIEDRARFSDWPEVPVITKPYRPDVIIDALCQLLQVRG